MREQPFSWKTALAIGFTGMLTSGIWSAFNTYVPIFLQAGNPQWQGAQDVPGFGLGATFAFFIMTWDNLFHMFISPWAGSVSDRTWTRFGRRKTWLLAGLPLALIGLVSIPYATSLPLIVLFIILVNFGTALYRAPLRAWVGDMFAPQDRNKGDSIIHLMGGISVMLVLIVGGRLYDSMGRGAPFWLTLALCLLASVIISRVKEPEVLPQQHLPESTKNNFLASLRSVFQSSNRSPLYALLSIFFFHMGFAAFQTGAGAYGVFELGLTPGRSAQLVGILAVVYVICAVPSGYIATRLGTRRTMSIGLLLFTIMSLVVALIVSTMQLYAIMLVVGGIAWALIFVNSLPLFLNIDETQQTGVFTGLYFMAFQFANVVGPVIAGALVQATGSQRMIWYVGAAGMACSFLMLTRVTEKDFSEMEALIG